MSRKCLASWALVFTFAIALTAWVAYRAGSRRAGVADPARAGDSAGSCIDLEAAAAHTNEQTCVKGRILRVYAARSGTVFFDFCDDYRDCPFSSLVFAADRNKFRDLGALGGKTVEIRGRMTLYHGKPEIVVREPSQIQGVDGSD